ncbi:DMT family transporter [Actinoplanes awajinensis]|uniref:Transporter n=1 Tax=Actinoplanes awajinensis subsp. mycoplanecinus TaxID=135947 RepID=A0A101JIH8_9ACTN|nr:DMT family transporter [Actinoplanes awajinensis]KUL27036.1 transporter [Actinoplanes awajinensis subsp. mycoplanecinus]
MGPLLLVLSAACFGAMAIFGKLAFAAGVTPGTLLLVRFALAAAILTAIVLLRRPAMPVRMSARTVLTAFGLGAFGYALQAGLYFAALQRMDATLLALIFYVYPLLVTVGAVLLGRDLLTPRRVAALLVASAGTLLVLLGAGAVSFDVLGAVLAFGCALTYTAYILVSDTVVRRLPASVLSALVMTGATLGQAVYAPLAGGVDLGFGAAGWFWLVCVALVSTVLAMVAFLAGLRRTGPSTAAILSTFEPVVTAALAGLVLHETLTPVQYGGGLLVLTAAVVLQLRPVTARRALVRTKVVV